jgi:predicted XRE-type DNA-binding protein
MENIMERHFNNLREECRFFGVRMQTISEKLKMTQPYVSQVLAGKRQNSAILGLCMELLKKRKNELKEKLCHDNIRTT